MVITIDKFLLFALIAGGVCFSCFFFLSQQDKGLKKSIQESNKILAKIKSDKISKALSEMSNIKNNPDCPIQITRLSLLDIDPIDYSEGPYKYCIFIFENASENNVKSIKYDILCFDSFGDPVAEPPQNIIKGLIQNKSVEPGQAFGSINDQGFTNEYNKLDLKTNLVDIIITDVLFSDGTRWMMKDKSN